jgi:hypothetical protein
MCQNDANSTVIVFLAKDFVLIAKFFVFKIFSFCLTDGLSK